MAKFDGLDSNLKYEKVHTTGLTFGGRDLENSCNMYILGCGTFGSPSRDVEQIHIPGRNGDILIDNGGWNNIEVTYPNCAILENFNENVQKLRGYLYSNPGYQKLVDPYHPDEFRMAEFRGPFEPTVHTGRNNDSGMFDLNPTWAASSPPPCRSASA